jgi:hypothetical protein
MRPFVSWQLDVTKGRTMSFRRKEFRALAAATAAWIITPVFAQAHDDPQAMEKSSVAQGDHLPVGSKRLLREMAMTEGDPQGLVAVPHGSTLVVEQASHEHDRAMHAVTHDQEHHISSHKED